MIPAKDLRVEELVYDKRLKHRLKQLFDRVSLDNCFITYSWFDSWLDSLSMRPKLLFVSYKKEDIGAIFFSKIPLTRAFPWLTIAHFNKSPLPEENQVWIEFNSIICKEESKALCAHAITSHLLSDRMLLGLQLQMAPPKSEWLVNDVLNLSSYEVEEVKGYKRQLRSQQNFNEFLKGFSSGVRSEFNRSKRKAIKDFGELELKFAEQKDINSYFEALSQLHKQKWCNTTDGSGFENEKFLKHHQKLINEHQSSTEIVCLVAGDFVLGYQYYLISKNKAYFYCAGLETKSVHKHIKPGLMLHILTMYEFSKAGFEEYDFLGGEANYKNRLADEVYSFFNIRIYKKSLVASLVRFTLNSKRIAKRLFSKF